MNWRADRERQQRAGLRRATASALCLIAITVPAPAIADADGAMNAVEPSAVRDFPKRLAITVVGKERPLSTFQQRVGSWFSDGTEVLVTVTSEVDPQQLLASSPVEVRAWIVPLSTGDALLSFSCVSPPAAPRHLVREVRLRSGFDELGLERLASVIHSAFVALSQGAEGVEREEAERELGAVGLAVGTFAVPSEPASAAPPAPSVVPEPPAFTLATPAVAPPANDAPATPHVAIRALEPRAALLFAAGYGLRLRGAEGVGHGPSLGFGVQLPAAGTTFDLQLIGQYLFRSEFEAAPFSASIQTSVLRVQVGVEPQLKSSWFGQVLLGLGADIARISARSSSSSAAELLLVPHANGTQMRSMGELSLGILRRGEVLDLGLVVQAIFSFQEVLYSATTSDGDAVLVKPWVVQPALSLQGRFRSAL